MLFKLFKPLTTLSLGLILASTSIGCKSDKKDIKPIDIAFNKEGELNLYKSKTDSIITTLDIEIADTEYDTQTGLMYRNTMLDNQGMLFVFPNMEERSFYMKNTRIALDIIYLDDKKTIVSFQENTKPFNEASLPSNAPAQYVLEVNAGLAKQWLLKVGDSMNYSNNQKK